MNAGRLQIKLTWVDPATGEQREPTLTVPIALGRDFNSMPAEIDRRPVARMVLATPDASRSHTIIDWENNQLVAIDQNSSGGTFVNGVRQTRCVLASGDTLQIGSIQIEVTFSALPPANAEQIGLSWEDPATGERNEEVLLVPIAIGREIAQMPVEFQGRMVTRLRLESGQVSRFHAILDLEQGQLVVTDKNSGNGTFVNGVRQTQSALANGDTLQIGPYQIAVKLAASTPGGRGDPAPTRGTVIGGGILQFTTPTIIGFNPDTGLSAPEVAQSSPQPIPKGPEFPPPAFRRELVSIQDLHATGLQVDEINYAAIGAGLGSFIWVDLLRIGGVKVRQVVALGLEPKPYARYKQLCLNSQIPLHERLRSNSDSCPDNIWGWPSYALREAWHDLRGGKIGAAVKYLWQVFAEPILAQTYTPRAGNVFDSIDREAARIGWDKIFHYGRVRAIRKTEDGRYAIAYSGKRHDHAFLIVRYLHLAPGYPAIQFLPDLQEYREKTGDFKSVVNAYEEHNHVYEHLQRNGGTVLIRGRGIVASRIVQRIFEARKFNPNIQAIHLLRSPKPEGNKYGKAKRRVENHYEFQPFNWPKACWGGELRDILEKADPQQRRSLLSDWGGTTTADRSDWKRIVRQGLKQGWYNIIFGEVEKVERNVKNRTVTHIREQGIKGKMSIEADFIIDATGLDARVNASPLLEDMVNHYNLPLNYNGRLAVENDFEIEEMRSHKGRMYTAGAITFGGPYAPADSFLGLQYAALRSIESLARSRSPGLKPLHPVRSLVQWLKWVFNESP